MRAFVLLYGAGKGVQSPWEPKVIAVEECYVFTSGFSHADIARRARAAISLPYYPHFAAQTLQKGLRFIL
jgi:hypothetical protein